MAAIEVVEHHETPNIGTIAIDTLPKAMIDKQSADVDIVAGASVTSTAMIQAVKDAMAQAGL